MKRLLLAATLAILGAALAALVASSPARAWDVTNLPAGYSTAHWHDSSPPPGSCSDGWSVVGFSASISIGECDPAFQQKLDDFINATCPCATTAAATTPSTDTATITTDTASATTTDPVSTTPPPTQPPPPVDPPVNTTTQTIAAPPDKTAVEISALDARITALEQQIAALTTRVDRITLAGDASWLAYQQSIANGDSPEIAALMARGTWMNAVYGLGAFA